MFTNVTVSHQVVKLMECYLNFMEGSGLRGIFSGDTVYVLAGSLWRQGAQAQILRLYLIALSETVHRDMQLGCNCR